MATKKVTAVIKLQCPAGAATPAPPIGPALGPHGVPAPKFVQEFNDRTKNMEKGLIIPVVITAYQDKSFTFILKTPPAAVLSRKQLDFRRVLQILSATRLERFHRNSLRKLQNRSFLILTQMTLKQLRKSSLVLHAVWV
jgi:hypothetical protein